MKRSVLLSLPLLAAATLASAQTPAPPAGKKPPVAPATKPAPPTNTEDRVAALTTNMAQALGLTPAQTEKVRDINAKSVRSVETARQRYSTNPTKLRGAIEDIGLARLEQLKDVLTPAQFSRYQQKREEKLGVPTVRGYQGTPPPGMGGNGRGGDE
jgi:predicted transglutaminase-like cysteine proteinase